MVLALVHFNTLLPNTAGRSSQGAACSVLIHTPFLLQSSEAESSLSWLRHSYLSAFSILLVNSLVR